MRCVLCGADDMHAWRAITFREWCQLYQGSKVTPEGKVKIKIKELLRKYRAYWHMPVQNGMGAPALDFHVCHNGRYLGIEAKAPGKEPTPRQLITAREITEAGGVVFFCDGTNLDNLELWLMEVK
jgi:hypothetical protein